MYIAPEWFRRLGTYEAMIAYLKLTGREDLLSKLETEGFLYVNEVFETPHAADWSYEFKSEDWIDFDNLQKRGPCHHDRVSSFSSKWLYDALGIMQVPMNEGLKDPEITYT